MSLSIYDVTVPVLRRGLSIVARYMDKGAAHASEQDFDPSNLIGARLYPDMAPLSAQVQRTSDTSKSAMVRLGGLEAPSFPDTETTFAELKARAEKTIAYLDTVTPAQLAGSETKRIELKMRGQAVVLTGQQYALSFALPNFFFHVTTLHDILRHNGVKVGKADYLGDMPSA